MIIALLIAARMIGSRISRYTQPYDTEVTHALVYVVIAVALIALGFGLELLNE
jgi:hypothetical protein